MLMAVIAGQLVGTWRLVSMELYGEDGSVVHRYGPDLQGYLVYGADGYMCTTLHGSDLLPLEPEPPADSDVDRSVLACSGRFEVHGDMVVHHPHIAYMPGGQPIPQEHMLRLENGQMILSTMPTEARGMLVSSRMVWERAR